MRTQTLAHSTFEGSPFPLTPVLLEEGLPERLHLLWGDRALLPLAFRYLSKCLLMFPRADFKSSVICRPWASAQCQVWSSPRTWTQHPSLCGVPVTETKRTAVHYCPLVDRQGPARPECWPHPRTTLDQPKEMQTTAPCRDRWGRIKACAWKLGCPGNKAL